ncbi:MAG: DUF4198 domain-containing protein [Pyrinomonadaceae bacterium]
MKIRILSTVIMIACLMVSIAAHDLFLKLDTYFVKPGEKISISVLNGSFQGSEGAVSFARLADASVVWPGGERSKAKETEFTKNDKTAFFNFEPTKTGTYVAGLSTMPREIELNGKDFNEYLVEDGIPDTLAERQRLGELEKPVRERYSKHVKAIFQAGDKRTDNYKTAMGYPVEILLKKNPYSLKVGDTLEFVCIKDGKPIAGQYVMTGRDDGTNLRVGENVRANKKGVARVKLSGSGKWYFKFINMTRLDDPKLNYESKWASISFEIR